MGGSFLKAKEDLHGHIIRQNEVKALVIHDDEPRSDCGA